MHMRSNLKIRVPADIHNLNTIRLFVEQAAAAYGADLDGTYDLSLAVYEAANNIVEHGYRGEPGSIEVEAERNGDSLIVHLRDQAPEFDPTQVPTPDITLPLEKRPIGGLGVYLIKACVDRLDYRALPRGGNELTLVKCGIL